MRSLPRGRKMNNFQLIRAKIKFCPYLLPEIVPNENFVF